MFWTHIGLALHGLCPRCRTGKVYKSRFGLDIVDRCSHCGLPLAENDNGDGPAVFLIFILGFTIVPLAVLVDIWLGWPLWLHAVIWGGLGLAVTVGLLRPAKAYILVLQFRHRPEIWDAHNEAEQSDEQASHQAEERDE